MQSESRHLHIEQYILGVVIDVKIEILHAPLPEPRQRREERGRLLRERLLILGDDRLHVALCPARRELLQVGRSAVERPVICSPIR